MQNRTFTQDGLLYDTISLEAFQNASPKKGDIRPHETVTLHTFTNDTKRLRIKKINTHG